MNQFFNITRFSRLAMYDARTNYKKYLTITAIGFVGIFLLTYFLFTVSTNTETWSDGNTFESRLIQNNFQISGFPSAIVFMLCLMFVFPILLMLSFPALSGKKSTMNYLLLPTSAFEKYLLEFFIRIAIAFGLFLLIFYLMANLATIIYESHLNFRFADIVANHGRSIYIERFTLTNSITFAFPGSTEAQETAIRSMIIIAWASMGLCMFSIRTFFNRFAFVKTLAVIIGAQILLTYLGGILGRTEVDVLAPQFLWTVSTSFALIAVVCLILGYYNIKRKRI
jgi:hypothetical protein